MPMSDTTHHEPAEGGDLPETEEGAARREDRPGQKTEHRPSAEQAARNREDDPPA
jgi:hypothetical protein